MRFHVVALPHTQTSKAYCACAYTQKVLNFCKMMRSLNHDVVHYGAEGSEADADEHVSIITADEQAALSGVQRSTAHRVSWNAEDPLWKITNCRAAAEIMLRAGKKDFVCLIGGTAQKPIADMLPKMMAVEYGIGYYGVFAKYRVFESYTHQSVIYGRESRDPEGRFYDIVIPNSYDLTDFPAPVPGKKEYLLFVGRMIRRKGVAVAVRAARAAGIPLLLAGPGLKEEGRHFVTEDGERFEREGVEYVGMVNVQERGELMKNARALLAPTLYVEPFGGVAVEAQLCGTPAITTDWGAFSETVIQGETGFRCRTLQDFVAAIRNVDDLRRLEIAKSARERYSIEVVRRRYHYYFRDLENLWEKGWETLEEEDVLAA